jgi:hypothetical protein
MTASFGVQRVRFWVRVQSKFHPARGPADLQRSASVGTAPHCENAAPKVN